MNLFKGKLFVPSGDKIDIHTTALQIVSMQAAFYFSNALVLGILTFFLVGISNIPEPYYTSHDQIFSPDAFTISSLYGWVNIINYLI